MSNVPAHLEPCPMGCVGEVIGGEHEAACVYCKVCHLRAVSPEAWNTRAQPAINSGGEVEAAMIEAIDVADRLIERGYGVNVPGDWNAAVSKVQSTRAALAAMDRAPMPPCKVCGIANPSHFSHYAPFDDSYHEYQPEPRPVEAGEVTENGIGTRWSPGCWYWFQEAWSDVIVHDGSASTPDGLDPDEPVLIAYNPVECQTAETWGAAMGRADAAKNRDWECVTAYRRLRAALSTDQGREGE